VDGVGDSSKVQGMVNGQRKDRELSTAIHEYSTGTVTAHITQLLDKVRTAAVSADSPTEDRPTRTDIL